ncbi:MAG: LacI family DNA-binding transcriptional regulator [Opitutaceae bacterium]|nr:LacI family DNA-binding transcriptional regulator [Opitutaceae bacterium]
MVPPPRNEPDPKGSRRPTLKDVAQKAGGVHPSTVSLAMRNHPGISEVLRKRIKAAAAELGYRPDPLLDAFNTHRVSVQSRRAHATIAWVVAAADRAAALADPHLSALWEGAKAAADHFHCQLEPFFVGPAQLTPSRLNTVLRTRGITGVILVRLPSAMAEASLSWEHYCAIRIESHHLAFPLYSISPDYRQALRLAWRRLRDDGASRIGLALGRELEPAIREQILMAHEFETSRLAPSAQIEPVILRSQAELPRWTSNHSVDALIVAGMPGHHEVWGGQELPASLISLDGPGAPPSIDAMTYDGTAVGTQAVEQTVMLMRTNQRGHPRAGATTFLPFHWRPAKTGSTTQALSRI